MTIPVVISGPLMFLKQLTILIAAANALVSVPLKAPMYPLSVRSPYLSAWIKGVHDPDGTSNHSAEFWNGQVLGWNVLAKLNGTIFSLFGADTAEIGTTKAAKVRQEYTADAVTLSYVINQVNIDLIFTNPVTLDYLRQSIPFSYLEILSSVSRDNEKLQLYLDINGAWLSGDRANFISWALENTTHEQTHPIDRLSTRSSIISHKIHRTSQLLFTENGDMAEWGELYWSTDESRNLTYSTGSSAERTRKSFAEHGKLNDNVDDEFRPSNLAEPVFAFAKSFDLSPTVQSALFTIGLVQDQALQVNMPASGYQIARPLYQRYFNTTTEMIRWHYDDYDHPSHHEFARKSALESSKIDDRYSWITSLCTIQAIGGTQLVVNAEDPDGPPHLWMKEISSDGNMQTSDVLFPAFPFFLYANPKMAVALLEPLLVHQEGGLYPHKYAMHDMGASYPNATGHPDGKDEKMPVEECGNNLIMMLATHDALLVKATNKDDRKFAKEWISSHYEIALQWTQFDYGLITESQLSTDDFAGTLANQTNLAIKAIVGIKCMSIIAGISNHDEESERLDAISIDYVQRWLLLAYDEGVPFAKLAYQWKGSWTSLYNLYPDRLLNLHLFPQFVYDQQDAWYAKIIQRYGVPLDSRHLYTKLDWELFIASFSSPSLSRTMYERIANWMNQTTVYKPLIDLYETIEGTDAVHLFTNRPVVGAAFAHLAMNMMEEGREVVTQSRRLHSREESDRKGDL